MKKGRFLLFLLLITACSFIFPQSAERLERLLEQDRVSYQDAALLVLEASNRLDPLRGTSPLEAFNFAQAQGFLPGNAEAEGALNLKELSFLVMQAFDIRGGFFYTLTKSRHHAYRELVSRSIIQGRADPLMHVSGDMLLFVVSRTLTVHN